jgi:hypothetical protein
MHYHLHEGRNWRRGPSIAQLKVKFGGTLVPWRLNKSPTRKRAAASLTEHGIQPDQATDEVVEIHVPALV